MLDTALEGDAVRGRLKADGDLANQPVALEGQFARNADGGIQVPNLKGSWASANVDVANLAVTPNGATGHGHLTFAKLEDLAPLLGTPLAGALDLDIATEPDDAGKVKVALRGDKLRSGTTGVQSLQLDATVTDPLGVAAADANLKADGLSGVAICGALPSTVKGDMKAFDATVGVIGVATNANVTARIEPSPDEIKVALQKFDGRYQGIPVALASPTQARVIGRASRDRPDDAAAGRRYGAAERRGRSGRQQSHGRHHGPAAQPGSIASRQAPTSRAACRPRRRSTARLPIRSLQASYSAERRAGQAAGDGAAAGAGAAGHGIDGQPAGLGRCAPVGRRRHQPRHQGQGLARGTGAGRARRLDRYRAVLAGARPQRAQRARHGAARSHAQHQRPDDHRLGHGLAHRRHALAAGKRHAAHRRRRADLAAGRHAADPAPALPDRAQRRRST